MVSPSITACLMVLAVGGFLLLLTPQPVSSSSCSQPTSTTQVSFKPNPPRAFPICVGRDPDTDNWDKDIVALGFHQVFDDIDKKRNTNPAGFEYNGDKDSFFPNPPANPQKTTRAWYLTQENLRYVDPSTGQVGIGKVMENWYVIDLFGLFLDNGVKKSIKGLFVQGVQGPGGFPFGDLMNFEINRNPVYTDPPAVAHQKQPPPSEYTELLRPYPCTYYPKASVKIPEVLFWRSRPGYSGHQGRLTVIIRFDDNACAEVAYFQLIIIAVYDFATLDYRVGLSPIFFPTAYTLSVVSLTSPLYPDFRRDEYGIFSDSDLEHEFTTPPGLTANDNYKLRILSNFRYEACVQHHVGLVKTGSQKGACPPGPFRCSAASMAARPTARVALKAYKDTMWRNYYNVYRKYTVHRPECSSPPTTTTIRTTTRRINTTLPPIPKAPSTTTRRPTILDSKSEAKDKLAQKTERKKVINHGDLCVFVWFVAMPLSNYLVRFFSDFPNWQPLGMGFWILGHIIIHHVAVIMMWIGFGLVISNGVNFLGGASATHYLVGFPVVIIQHYQLYSGYTRDRGNQKAYRQSIYHATLGYTVQIAAVFCAQASQIGVMKMYVLYSLFAVQVVAIFLGTFCEVKVGQALGMFPGRKVCPLERVMMVNCRPKHFWRRVALASITCASLCGLYGYWLYLDDDKS